MKKKILFFILCLGLFIGSYGIYEYLAGGKCNPKGTCTACKNCSGCKHCHKEGGTCSVCRK